MARLLRLVFLGWGLLLAGPILASPGAIILQKFVAFKETDPNVPIGTILASELDEAGRVTPIVWSLSDPIFRTALDTGELKVPLENPNDNHVRQALKVLRAEYVMVVSITRSLDGKTELAKSAEKKGVKIDPTEETPMLHGELRLYRGGKEIWKDARNFAITIDQLLDMENSLRSMARTWSEVLSGGPFKGLTPKPRAMTPNLEPSLTNPVEPALNQVNPPPVQNQTETIAEAMKLLAAGQPGAAILRLRDAIDATPTQTGVRKALVEALLLSGQNVLAASEARRAAEMFPEALEFRLQAARAWTSAGQPAEAAKDLQEAVARDPEHGEVRRMMGELAIDAFDLERADQHLSAAIAKSPTADAFFLRGLVRALRGDAAAAGTDFAESKKLQPELSPVHALQRYRTAVQLVDKGLDRISSQSKSLVQASIVSRNNPGLMTTAKNDIKAASQALEAMVQLAGTLEVPPGHKNSHERRLLAQNLLQQSLTDLVAYIDSGDEDVLSEVNINLGEALKHLMAARDALRSETSN